jgi:hypothetical protein
MELEIRIVELVGSLLPNLDRYRNFMTQESENGTWVSSLVIFHPSAGNAELHFELQYGSDERRFGFQIKEGGTENVIGSLVVPGKIEVFS